MPGGIQVPFVSLIIGAGSLLIAFLTPEEILLAITKDVVLLCHTFLNAQHWCTILYTTLSLTASLQIAKQSFLQLWHASHLLTSSTFSFTKWTASACKTKGHNFLKELQVTKKGSSMRLASPWVFKDMCVGNLKCRLAINPGLSVGSYNKAIRYFNRSYSCVKRFVQNKTIQGT